MSITGTAAKIISMPIYTVLEGEHKEVFTIIAALESSPNVETGRSALFRKLRNELESHTVAEQIAVYDKLKMQSANKDLVAEAEREHETIDKLLNEMESIDMTSDAWLIKLDELKNMVNHHVREEETEIFDRLRQQFTDEEAKDMSKDFMRLKTDKLKQLKN